MAFNDKESLKNLQSNIAIDDNNIRKRNGDWVVIIDEENAIVENKSISSNNDYIEKKEPKSIDIDRRLNSLVYDTSNYDDSICDFFKNVNLDDVLECLLIPISNIIIFLQKNLEVNENNNNLQLV